MIQLRDVVFRALGDAVENGYDLTRWAASEVVCDLCSHCAELEGRDPDDLLPHVIEWQLQTIPSG